MILKAGAIPVVNGRRPYELGDREIVVHHFVTRTTTPMNPFKPHKHAAPELWYMTDGEALVTLDGVEHLVEDGDLIVIDPWVEHGLRAEKQATWICLG
jgi:mannose-6-phosphate isomerase-like protein (cupin superfamily)